MAASIPSTLPPAIDPYDAPPTLWQRYPHLGWVLGVFVTTVVLTYVSFPPVAKGEFAFAFALPAVLWAYRAPPFKVFVWTMFAAQAVAWTSLLGWLHHVTWVGLFLLGPFIGALIGLWYLAVWWAMPKLRGHRLLVRVIGLFGLAGLWVFLEYGRGWLFGGFPWLPLAASQWERPFMLQIAAYAGAWATSFVLVVFNLGAAAVAHRAFFEKTTGLKRRSPEFTITLLVLIASTFPFLADTFNQQRQQLLRVAVVQPYIPQNEKWDPARSKDVMRTIQKLTLDAAEASPADVILWPEASVPWPLRRDPNMALWLESLARNTGTPLLLGAVAVDDPDAPETVWRNGAFIVEPEAGVQYPGYAKRRLVQFGEYIPLRPVLGWLDKFVPIGGDFTPGESARPLALPVGRKVVRVGTLICYEDIFPRLARASAQEGAELLVVLTNSAWYGEGGAAYQHAAHSVLRAVETRRPVLRGGNGGWSGWIDEFGRVRSVLTNEENSIYYRGAKTINVTRDARWMGQQSFYTQTGDWFVALSAILAALAAFVIVMMPAPPKPVEGETVF